MNELKEFYNEYNEVELCPTCGYRYSIEIKEVEDYVKVDKDVVYLVCGQCGQVYWYRKVEFNDK